MLGEELILFLEKKENKNKNFGSGKKRNIIFD